MSGLALAHVVAVFLWGGLVIAEIAMEIAAVHNPELRYAMARFHHKIDLIVEWPLLAAVLVTGTALLLRSQADLSLWVKVAFGLGAVGANLACVPIVIRRGQIAAAGADEEVVDTFTRWVFVCIGVGVPMGLAALYLGGHRANWW